MNQPEAQQFALCEPHCIRFETNFCSKLFSLGHSKIVEEQPDTTQRLLRMQI